MPRTERRVRDEKERDRGGQLRRWVPAAALHKQDFHSAAEGGCSRTSRLAVASVPVLLLLRSVPALARGPGR
jgi:hypothetical protein